LVEKEHTSYETDIKFTQEAPKTVFYGFLIQSGYLTQAPITEKDRKYLKLQIPN
jgi:hypothetical protein